MSKPSATNAPSTEVKILCEFCDVRNDCSRRSTKEKYEQAGWITRCMITPNRPSKRKCK